MTGSDTLPALQIADLRSTRANLALEEYRLKVRLTRLQAEAREEKSFAPQADAPVEFGEQLISDIVASEQAQLQARLSAFRDEVSYLEESLARARKEADMLAESRDEREKTANLQLEELQSARTLRDKGLTTNSNVMALERTHTSYRADLADTQLQEVRSQQDALNLESQIQKKRRDHDIEVIGQIQDTQIELGKTQSQIRYVSDKLLYLFSYGEQRTFEDLQNIVKIAIFRRDRGAAHDLVADENTEVKAGDVIEISVVPNKSFYAPDTVNSGMVATGKSTPGTQPGYLGQ